MRSSHNLFRNLGVSRNLEPTGLFGSHAILYLLVAQAISINIAVLFKYLLIAFNSTPLLNPVGVSWLLLRLSSSLDSSYNHEAVRHFASVYCTVLQKEQPSHPPALSISTLLALPLFELQKIILSISEKSVALGDTPLMATGME